MELILAYDEDIIFNNSELSGFFLCCQESEYSCYDSHIYKWPSVPASCASQASENMVEISLACLVCKGGVAPSLAYLWRETPIATPIWGAPVYAATEYSLPSAPWIMLASQLPVSDK